MTAQPSRFDAPEVFNIADYYLGERLQEGRGDRVALRIGDDRLSYRHVAALADHAARDLKRRGVRPDDRVMIALPDGPEFVATLFGTLQIGAVVVMVNPGFDRDAVAGLYAYTRCRVVVVDTAVASVFREAADQESASREYLAEIVEIKPGSWRDAPSDGVERLECFPTHADDPALWLFSGGTTGRPKAVVQTHRSFANTTELYAKQTLGYHEDDITLSVPKLYFGYATGSNLFFPFSVGGTAVLFPEHPTAEVMFEQIASHRPTILINVPTLINRMVGDPRAAEHDLSSLRFATSAGEALPVPLYHRWKELFGVELLDGLGTAEMWHVFVTNRLGDVRPGTLGRVVEGFDLRVRDDDGRDLPADEVGRMWVRGDSRALCYWQNIEKTSEAFRGEWFVGGDLVRRDADGYVTYCGRADDVLKVAGKWLVPQEVESCLMKHEAVKECAVVGVENEEGLMKPYAFVLAARAMPDLEGTLKAHTLERLDAYKHPRRVIVLDEFPRTHLGKVDRGKLKTMV